MTTSPMPSEHSSDSRLILTAFADSLREIYSVTTMILLRPFPSSAPAPDTKAPYQTSKEGGRTTKGKAQ